MSTNAQVRVRARKREYFSIDRCLGSGGGTFLCSVLEQLCSGGYTPEIRQRLPWKPVPGRERTYTRKVGEHDVMLELAGTVPRLTVSGLQRTRQVDTATLRNAHAAVNQLLALAICGRVAEKLSVYASEKISSQSGERVSQSVALKSLELQQSLAIRASCKILVNA